MYKRLEMGMAIVGRGIAYFKSMCYIRENFFQPPPAHHHRPPSQPLLLLSVRHGFHQEKPRQINITSEKTIVERNFCVPEVGTADDEPMHQLFEVRTLKGTASCNPPLNSGGRRIIPDQSRVPSPLSSLSFLRLCRREMLSTEIPKYVRDTFITAINRA